MSGSWPGSPSSPLPRPPPVGVGFPQGEAPAAHSWWGRGRNLRGCVPAAPEGGPGPRPGPPAAIWPCPSWERGGASPHSSAPAPPQPPLPSRPPQTCCLQGRPQDAPHAAPVPACCKGSKAAAAPRSVWDPDRDGEVALTPPPVGLCPPATLGPEHPLCAWLSWALSILQGHPGTGSESLRGARWVPGRGRGQTGTLSPACSVGAWRPSTSRQADRGTFPCGSCAWSGREGGVGALTRWGCMMHFAEGGSHPFKHPPTRPPS